MDSKISQLPELANLQGSEDFLVAVNGSNQRVKPRTLGSFMTNGGHAHVVADVTGLQSALDTKANSADVNTMLDGKAAASHAHEISSVTGLQSELDLKATKEELNTRITEVMGGVSPDTLDSIKELSTALKDDPNVVQVLTDGLTVKADKTYVDSQLSTKANSSDVAISLNDKSDKTHVHALSDVTGLDTALNGKASNESLVSGLSTKADSTHVHTKTEIGLSDVDNTSDANKPVSIATQTALNGKAEASHTHSYTKSDVGLDNVDNTSDVNKPVSAAVQTVLDTKADTSYVDTQLAGKSDNSHTHTKSDIGLSNVDNTSDADKPISNAVQLSLVGKAAIDHTHTKADVGLNNVDNTGDSDKPISILTQAALDTLQSLINGKSDLSHTHTKSDIGLGNVDNTSDADKEISTATQTALDNKANVQYVDSQLQLKASVDDLSLKADVTYVDAQLTTKADVTALSDLVTTGALSAAVATSAAVVHTHSSSDITDLEAYVQTRIDQAMKPRFNVNQSPTNDGVDLSIVFSRLNAYTLNNLSIKVEHKASSADDSTYVETTVIPLSNGTYSYTGSVTGVGSGYDMTTRVSLINVQDMDNVLVVKENTVTTL